MLVELVALLEFIDAIKYVYTIPYYLSQNNACKFNNYPYIDSEINRKRHFIKIPFIYKEMAFISFPSIFKFATNVTNLLGPVYLTF